MTPTPGRALLPLLVATALACSSEEPSSAAVTLARIEVAPAAPRLRAGPRPERFYATAVYSDGSAVDVTAQATWTTSAPATLSLSGATPGEATPLAAGTATLTAAWDGVSGATTATVIAAADASAATLAGTVTWDFVPARYDAATDTGTLDFDGSVPRPARGAVVRAMRETTVLAETTTDDLGGYQLTFAGATGTVSVVALARTLSPRVQVEDNTDGDAVWAVGSDVALPAAGPVDLHAGHGWNGVTYPGARAAAPFAILDATLTAARGVLAVRSPLFPALRVNWSPLNVAAAAPNGYPDVAEGLIVTSHYSGDGEIYILGKDGDDTDEFDAHVVVHEWGHYFEDRLSRSDSPGGSHGIGDVLDPRLAFGEGYGSALAAMLLPRDVYGIYADTFWERGALDAFGFDAETAPPETDDCVVPWYGGPCQPGGQNPGPFSEMSIIRLLHDLWDDSGTDEAWDDVALGLGPIYDVLVGPQRTTPALTTIASFVAGLKDLGAVDPAKVDALLAHYSIGPITDAWGTGDADLAAMYASVAVPSTTTVALDGHFAPNMQAQNHYLVFTAKGTATRVTSSSSYDVDLYAYGSGKLLDWAESTSGNETLQFATVPDQVYVVVVTGWRAALPDVNGAYTARVTVSTP